MPSVPRMTKRYLLALAVMLGLASLVMPQASAAPSSNNCAQLDRSLQWYGDNASKLQQLVDEYGKCNKAVHGNKHPVATFDWDNTTIKNDAGDATTFWILRNDKVLQPPNKDWTQTSPYLTKDAAAALSQACGTTVAAGQPLPTSTNTACADELYTVYNDTTTTTGKPAFAGWNQRRVEASYAWVNNLLSGYNDETVTKFAEAARAENLANPVGATQMVGTKKVVAWVRYYDQMADLYRTLQKEGFDVWVITASPQAVIEAWAPHLGVQRNHIVGIQNVMDHGVRSYHTVGCGGSGEDQAITYLDGKRCFINERVFGVTGAAAWERQDTRQVFAAGDSTTDATFVRDATALRLVINRNKTELMCPAYFNGDGKWLINPMFIEPKAQKTSLYPCSTKGYTNPDGSGAPAKDDTTGAVIPDQADKVY